MKILVCVVLGALATVSCNSIGPFSSGPAKTFTTALMTANDGKYSDANEYLSSEVKQVVQGQLGALAGGTKGMWDTYTKNGTIQRIEVLKEEIRGEGATVICNIYYKDGSVKSNDKTDMIKEKGSWKIAS
jgi:hypothetical protein